MKQVIRKGLKEIAVEEVPDPVTPPHHVLIRPHYSLISSGTETASIHSQGVLKEIAKNPSHLKTIWEAIKEHGPIRTTAEVRAKFSEFDILGYSGAGEVLEKHPTVLDLEIGARVAYGGEGTGHAETVLTGRNLVARVPDNVSFDQACFSTLGAIAMNSVRIADLSLGEVVAVIGLGLVGQLVAQLARLQGARVIAIDLLQDRIDLATKLGAHHGALGGTTTPQMVAELTNGLGTDCVMIAAAAKSSAPCHQALELCRDRGRIVVIGAVDMSFPWNDMYLKEIQLFMSRAYGPGSYDPAYEHQGQEYPISYVRWTENRNMEDFLRLIGSGEVQVAPLISHRFPLDQAPDAYRTIMDPATNSLAVVLKYPASELPKAKFEPKCKVAILPASRKDGSIGVGLIGSGNLARWQHLPNINKNQHCRLIGIHSSNPVRGKSYATRFRADYCTTDERQLFEDPNIDAIVISSRNQHHARQAITALRAGKHVFVEKPMALTAQECRELCQAVQEMGKVLTVGFNRRFAPYYMAVKEQLRGRSGPVVINCRVNSPGISGDYWMADPTIGGAILGEACHFVDLMYWLLEAEPIRVSAYSLPTEKQDPVGENNVVAAFEFADGSVASLAYCTIGSKASGGEHIEVFAQGVAAITDNFTKLIVKKGTVRTFRRLWAAKGYRAQMEDFVDAMRTGREPKVTVWDGARATVGCLRMLESANTRLPCVFDLNKACGVKQEP
ncbi:MAG: bi-domain-containing oxidoreductase [Thermoguttaceae bacterium]|jgi:predicted dehydrogenase/threonine dehydrogenase-like Zn-dependent dehydrogenase